MANDSNFLPYGKSMIESTKKDLETINTYGRCYVNSQNYESTF